MPLAPEAPVTNQVIEVCLFRNEKDIEPKYRALTWDQLAKQFTTHVERRNKDGWLWSPATYRSGTTRSNEGVVSITAAVGDFDKSITYEQAKERLCKYEYVAHSTWRHTTDAPRFRVVIPFVQPIRADIWRDVKARIDEHVFGMATDAATKDACRIYYTPSCPPKAARFAEHHHGEWLDPLLLPPSTGSVATASIPRNGTGDATAPKVPLGKTALDFVANGAPLGEQRTRALAAGRNYLSAGYSADETAGAIWRGLQASPQDPEREPWTYGDAKQIAGDLADKTAPPLEAQQPLPPRCEMRRVGMGYLVNFPSQGVAVTVDRLRRGGDSLGAELLIEASIPLVPRQLFWGRVSLSNPNSRTSVERNVEQTLQRAGADGRLDIKALLNDVCYRVAVMERSGEPFQTVGNLPRTEEITWMIKNFTPRSEAMTLFGEGGCIAGDTMIAGPNGDHRADELCVKGRPITVWALGRKGITAAWATAPFRKGIAQLLRFDMADGRSVTVTGEHRFLTPMGWQHAAALHEGDLLLGVSPIAPSVQSQAAPVLHQSCDATVPRDSLQGAVHCPGISPDSQGDCWPCFRPYGEQSHRETNTDLESAPLQGGVPERSHSSSHEGGQCTSPECSHPDQQPDLPSKRSCVAGVLSEPVEGCRDASWHATQHSGNSLMPEPSQKVIDHQRPTGESSQLAAATGGDLYAFFLPPLTSLYHTTISAVTKLGEGAYYDLQVPGYENYLANGIWHHNSGKSYLALAMALSVFTGKAFVPGFPPLDSGPTLYLDWEAGPARLDQRVKRLCAGMGMAPVDIPYRRCAGALADQVEEVLRYCQSEKIVMVVVDSVEMAIAASGGEDRDINEPIKRLYAALRLLKCSAILVDHVSKEGLRNKGKREPYGGIYKINLARMVWELRSISEPNSGVLRLALHNTKRNDDGPTLPTTGLQLTFGENSAKYENSTVEGEALGAGLKNHERISLVLRESPMMVKAIALRTGMSEDTVRATLSQNKDRFVKAADGRWGNVESRYEEEDVIPF